MNESIRGCCIFEDFVNVIVPFALKFKIRMLFCIKKKVNIMNSDIFGATLAFGGGVIVAVMNYLFSRHVIKKHPEQYATMQVVKQMIQILYMVALFTLGKFTPWDRIWLLVGGTLGITLPMFWFTYKLVKLNDSLHRKEESTDE